MSQLIKPLKQMTTLIKAVIYGRSGTGKTTFSSSFPKPILFLDIKDDGLASVGDTKDCDYVRVEDWESFEELYWFLEKDTKYKTVVIDTISQLQEMAMTAALDKKASKSAVIQKKGDWGTMTRREWGDVAALMKTWLLNYRDLDKNVVFIAQDRTFNIDEDGGSVDQQLMPEVGPRLMPSVAAVLNAAVSIIGHTYIRINSKKVRNKEGKIYKKEIPEYCLRIGPNPVYTTKVRKPKDITVPNAIIDPTYASLMDTLKGEVKNG